MSNSKRPAEWIIEPDHHAERSRRDATHPSAPVVKYTQHPDSGVGQNFHSVPYPLTLLPFKSWSILHGGILQACPIHGVICSSCRKPRTDLSPHQRKLFLVAERLSWELGTVSTLERCRNEEALWEVNAELGIYEPAVEDDDVMLGGRRSRENEWHPYPNRLMAEQVMKLIERAEMLTEGSWKMWKSMLGQLKQPAPVDEDTSAHSRPIISSQVTNKDLGSEKGVTLGYDSQTEETDARITQPDVPSTHDPKSHLIAAATDIFPDRDAEDGPRQTSRKSFALGWLLRHRKALPTARDQLPLSEFSLPSLAMTEAPARQKDLMACIAPIVNRLPVFVEFRTRRKRRRSSKSSSKYTDPRTFLLGAAERLLGLAAETTALDLRQRLPIPRVQVKQLEAEAVSLQSQLKAIASEVCCAYALRLGNQPGCVIASMAHRMRNESSWARLVEAIDNGSTLVKDLEAFHKEVLTASVQVLRHSAEHPEDSAAQWKLLRRILGIIIWPAPQRLYRNGSGFADTGIRAVVSERLNGLVPWLANRAGSYMEWTSISECLLGITDVLPADNETKPLILSEWMDLADHLIEQSEKSTSTNADPSTERAVIGEMSGNERGLANSHGRRKKLMEVERVGKGGVILAPLPTPPSSATEEANQCLPALQLPKNTTSKCSKRIVPSSASGSIKNLGPYRRQAPEMRDSEDPDVPPATYKTERHREQFLLPDEEYCAETYNGIDVLLPRPAQPATSASRCEREVIVQKIDTICETLQDFYSLLDKIERTSHMGARFLEAYAERLRDESCKECWFKQNVLSDEELQEGAKAMTRRAWTRSN